MPCPPVRECTIDDPVEDITICCPKCNRISNNILGSTPSEVTPFPNTTDENTSSTQSPAEPTVILIPDPPSKKTCKKPSHKVYISIDNQVDQIAIESIAKSYVRVYTWSNSSIVQQKSYTSHKFAKHLLNVKFKYFGSTTKGWHSKVAMHHGI